MGPTLSFRPTPVREDTVPCEKCVPCAKNELNRVVLDMKSAPLCEYLVSFVLFSATLLCGHGRYEVYTDTSMEIIYLSGAHDHRHDARHLWLQVASSPRVLPNLTEDVVVSALCEHTVHYVPCAKVPCTNSDSRGRCGRLSCVS